MKKTLLEEWILDAKLYCDKKAYNNIYIACRFILDEIYEAFSSIYRFIRDNKIDIYMQYYIIVWEAIKEYSFDCEEKFPYFLKKFTIGKIKKHIIGEYRIKGRFLVEDEVLDKLMSSYKEYPEKWLKRYRIYNSLGDSSPRTIQAVYYNCYKRLTREESAKVVGVSENTFNDRLRPCFIRVRNYYLDLRNRKISERIHETILIED